MKRIAFLLVLFCAGTLSAADEKEAWHRFLVGFAARSYHKVFLGKVVKTRVHKRGPRRPMGDSALLQVLEPFKGTTRGGRERVMYSGDEIMLQQDRVYLFLVTSRGALLLLDPPLPRVEQRIQVEYSLYPLKTIRRWIRDALPQDMKTYMTKNLRFYRRKREADKRKRFLHRLRLKELWLLQQVNKEKSPTKKALFLLQLGHNRLRQNSVDAAARSFLLVQQQYAHTPELKLRAAHGLALVRYRKGDSAGARASLEKLIPQEKKAGIYIAALHLALGRMYEKAGDKEQARTHYRHVAREEKYRHERRAFARFNLGEMAREEGKPALALEHFKSAMMIFKRHVSSELKKGGLRFPAYYFILKRRIQAGTKGG